VLISGALVEGRRAPERGSRPVLLRRAAQRTIVLGAVPGQREVIAAPPPTPGWMERWGLSDQLFEHASEFDAVWVIQEWHTTPRRRARAVARLDPSPSSSGSDAIQSWARELLSQAQVPGDDAELWRSYCQVAAALAE
jgi:hypothetical protein